MPERLVKAVSVRTIWCCYSSHSSADEIIDFLSSLQFESITPFVCPDKDTPLDSVKVFIFNTLKHQNANTSNDSSTKLGKEKIKVNKRGKRKLYLKKISTNTPDYKYHSEPLRQQRRFVEGGVFQGKDSETAKSAEETNISPKTPDYEYHSEPLRQHRRFVESGDFKENDSERNRKINPIAQKHVKTIFYFSYCIF